MKLLFVGPPGAGKGTQAERTAKHLGIAHISTGDMFRELDTESELGRRVSDIMQSGGYVPDSIVVELLSQRIEEPDAGDGYILDGFPRTPGQVDALDGLIGEDGLDCVVLFDVSEDALVERLMGRGRADDTEDTIRNRMRVYAEQTEPLIDLYEDRGILVRISGEGSIDDITQRVLESIAAA